MRKLLILLLVIIFSCSGAFATKIPDDVSDYIKEKLPNTDIRFDGVIILKDNTVYLPLFPSLFSDVKKLKIKETFPANMELSQRPDIVIFNNDFVLMKLISDNNGHKTVLHQTVPPVQVRTGLLPQDMLVPSGLILPENIKGIIGNLKIDTKGEDIIKLTEKEAFQEFIEDVDTTVDSAEIKQLKNKTMFAITNYSKNVQVLNMFNPVPEYALAQKSIPLDIEAVKNGKFVLVTSYDRPFVDVISVADSRFIKQINLDAFAGEILVDEKESKAYVTSPTISTIYVIDLNTMSLIQKIRVNGYCERLLKSENKIFYIDKLKSEIWAIEPEHGYELRDIGNFPNISDLAFADNKLFIASRTKSRIAVIDYSTLGLIKEFTTVNKPVALKVFGKHLYVLGAQDCIVQDININSGDVLSEIKVFDEGFTTAFNNIQNSNYAIIVDVKNNKYAIFDLSKGTIMGKYSLQIPIKNILITDKVELFK